MRLVTGNAAGGQGGAQVLGEVKVEQSQLFGRRRDVQTNPFPSSAAQAVGRGFVLDNLVSNCYPALRQLLNWA